MNRCWARMLPAILLSPLLFGCVGFRGPVDVHRELEEATGVRFEREFGITAGRTAVAIARWAVRDSEEDEFLLLDGVRKLQIGVYEPVGDGTSEHRPLRALDFPAWNPLIEVASGDGERVLVLSQQERGRTRRLLVVVDEEDELVLVRLKGKLDGLLRDAVRFALQEAERPELGEQVAAEMEEHVPAEILRGPSAEPPPVGRH